MIGADSPRREVQGLDNLGRHFVVGGAHLLVGDTQIIDLGSVDAAVVVANGVVAVLADIAQDAAHDFVGFELLAEGAEGRLADLKGQLTGPEGGAGEERATTLLGVPDDPHSRYLATAAAAASVERSMKASTSALVTCPIVSPSSSGSESRKPESAPSVSSTPLRRRWFSIMPRARSQSMPRAAMSQATWRHRSRVSASTKPASMVSIVQARAAQRSARSSGSPWARSRSNWRRRSMTFARRGPPIVSWG